MNKTLYLLVTLQILLLSACAETKPFTIIPPPTGDSSLFFYIQASPGNDQTRREIYINKCYIGEIQPNRYLNIILPANTYTIEDKTPNSGTFSKLELNTGSGNIIFVHSVRNKTHGNRCKVYVPTERHNIGYFQQVYCEYYEFKQEIRTPRLIEYLKQAEKSDLRNAEEIRYLNPCDNSKDF